MSKLEELIQKYCPDGVEWRKIGAVCKTNTPPYKLKTSEYQEEGRFPIIDQGQKQIVGFTDNEKALVQDGEYILYGDHTCIVKYHKGCFAQGADGLKILTAPFNSLKYVFYAFCAFNLTSTEYKRHWTQAKDIEIPIPPLPVQEEIVRVLDTFTDLQAELQAELQKRLQQYNYYRDFLLSFEGRTDVEWREFFDVCELVRGITYNKEQEVKNQSEDAHKVLRANNITLHLNTLNFDDVKLVSKDVIVKPSQMLYSGDILMCAGSGSKEHVGKVAYISEDMDYSFGGFMAVVRCKETILPRFMFHILTSSSFSNHLEVQINSSTINNINKQVMQSFAVPVPPITVQERIANLLDRFDTLSSSLSSGLPAEIEKRRQQYEFFRDKLLTFKRKEA